VIGHGRTNAERQDVLSEAEEARLISESMEGIVRHFGEPPSGWLGKGLGHFRPENQCGKSHAFCRTFVERASAAFDRRTMPTS
jgi:hypothetical protein